MKQVSLVVLVILCFALLALGQEHRRDHSSNTKGSDMSSEKAQESAHTGPAQVKVEYENESILVLRIHMGPHEKTPMHDVSPRMVVWLTDANLRTTLPGGETIEHHMKAGETGWVPAGKHAGENLSDKSIEFIAIVPKTK